ncbi:MAG: hypothetical protein ACQEWU_07220 [Bacillota bacterium]|uniref:DUF4083 domain-containing protein n=1 Tax=Virgibacillus salarius TaxID=447199 RepID=A0A941DVH9_9BACI|nr:MULTISPECIES: hypothetical protein [Bacillaceae]NAZ10778.1 hypothetical protein [Agaribacter marinus]MBR7798069.1 hypothetical protein [Virgibacillus salarius]MCC2250719.1 hypothetical protein [Virgibacillus sp. AGTR]MDY7046516.1 hypothetical protein [Virgibacillus sp. M23]QRZ17212.1 hypothetical protein JUJ52_15710 [Virgibacillus sp. AGTR]
MEIILMFAAGIIVLIIAVLAISKGITERIRTRDVNVKKKIANLENRIDALESKKR